MPATEHAALGASGAYRWMACPGSIRLSEQVPDQPTSEYALQGSAAHELAEMSLRSEKFPDAFLGQEITVEDDEGNEHTFVVDTEMASAVRVYIDHVLETEYDAVTAEGTPEYGYEVRFSLDDLDPPAPMFGTADAVCWNPGDRVLDVMDYKHGRGVVVDAEENPQLMYYALGAVLELGVRPETIRVTIVQPRAEHEDGPIRSWSFGWDRLVSFKEELMEAAHAASQPDASVGPVGDHCRFCPAKAICPAQRDNALEVTQAGFTSLAEDADSLPPAEMLSDEQLLNVLDVAEYVEDWFSEIRSHIKMRLMEGEEIPGYKLVKKRARRYWKDEDEARAFMEEHGIDPDRKKVRSPYQAEQAAKKLDDVEVPEELWEKKSSGFNLAPESNPREAVTPALLAAEEFSDE